MRVLALALLVGACTDQVSELPHGSADAARDAAADASPDVTDARDEDGPLPPCNNPGPGRDADGKCPDGTRFICIFEDEVSCTPSPWCATAPEVYSKCSPYGDAG
jgi:hypothetical protein